MQQLEARLWIATCATLWLAAVVQSELIIQRMSGQQPDRFTENENCRADTCTSSYRAEHLVESSCQCTCTQSKPTFSIHDMTCVESLPDCEDLTMVDGVEKADIFTILVSTNLRITPRLSVKHSLTGAELMKNLNCSTLAVKSVNYEIENGYEELRSPSVTVDTDPLTERTYLEFVVDNSVNSSRVDISGLLMKVSFECQSPYLNRSYCLPLKIHGFQNDAPEKTGRTLPPALPYIVGGTVLGVIVIIFLIVAVMLACATPKPPKADSLRVSRVERHWSINSSRKNPIRRILRGLSISDLRQKRKRQKEASAERRKYSASGVSTTSVDSGRGVSRTPSLSAKGEGGYDNLAVAEAVLDFESQTVNTPKHVLDRPRLFKTHQEQLSTARQGITSVPTAAHKQSGPHSSKPLSAFKRLFSKKAQAISEASGSRLSIDYDQFHIEPAPVEEGQANLDSIPPRYLGTRFSENHINPDVSFSTEGKLARTEEVHIEIPVAPRNETQYIENELYEFDSFGSEETKMSAGDEEMPETYIDDIEEAASEFDVYEVYEQPSLIRGDDFQV